MRDTRDDAKAGDAKAGKPAATIAVVDYRKGNLRSVERGLADAGVNVVVSDDPAVISAADGIVLPGVGAFADASATMIELGQMDAIRESVAGGTPFLGICLGLQLAFECGTEGCDGGEAASGLGFFAGRCEKMPARDEAGNSYKVPHVGWNSIDLTQAGAQSPLFSGIAGGGYFYFTHSYCVAPASDEGVLATTVHAMPFVSVMGVGNVFGTQFHPEKSSGLGLAVLRNFARIVEGRMA